MFKLIMSFFVFLFQCSLWNNSEIFDQTGILPFFWFLICMTLPFALVAGLFRKGVIELCKEPETIEYDSTIDNS